MNEPVQWIACIFLLILGGVISSAGGFTSSKNDSPSLWIIGFGVLVSLVGALVRP
jgi:hypothetical protein